MKKMSKLRTYSELKNLDSFEERFRYLQLGGVIGESTFGFDRYLNQHFYASKEWKRIRDSVILRDNGCDLGFEDNPIAGRIIIHHINPIDATDIVGATDMLLNPEYLISVSQATHNAIHYGDESLLFTKYIERTPNDTCPWKKEKSKGV